MFIVLLNVLSKRPGGMCGLSLLLVRVPDFSSASPAFLNSQKTNTPNANSMADVACSLNIVIYFYFSFVCILKCLLD